jgi:hypothetical protein
LQEKGKTMKKNLWFLRVEKKQSIDGKTKQQEKTFLHDLFA